MRGTLLVIPIIWTIFFSAITMADVWLRERPINTGGIILGILCAVAAIIMYYGVENDEYDEDG